MENKSKRFIRGSEEAKEFMANLRAKKRIKNLIPPQILRHLFKKIKKCKKYINDFF